MPQTPPTWTTGHDVQFYDSEDFLFSSVTDFVADGVAAGQPILMITTEAHRRGFEAQLRARHINFTDVAAAEILWLDARHTLAGFMERGTPNPELFEATVGNVFARMMANRSYLVVRAYGEMVDILWKEGNIEGAIAVEGLWNSLAGKYPFRLLCSYSMGNFFKEAHGHGFARICNAHRHVAPTEEYLVGDETERLKQIAMLQQRARSLEAEVQHRRELETALRDMLAHRRRVEDELRDREVRLRDALENGLQPMHWVGPDGLVIWVNPAECQMLGYTRDEMIGRPIAQFHADADAVADMLGRLTAGEELRDVQARLLRKDGSICRAIISSNVFRQDGKFVHTRCFTRDIGSLVS